VRESDGRKSGGNTAALHKKPDVTYNLMNRFWKELG
jgi:hypothetical protein